MLTYIAANVIRGNFSMNNPQPLVGMCHKDYDMTDLFDSSEHIDNIDIPDKEVLKEHEHYRYLELKRWTMHLELNS